MEVTGKIFLIHETQVFSDKFQKREFILEIENEKNSDWNDFVKFELIQDKVTVLDGLSINDKVTVAYNLKGRKWEKDGKTNYFNTLQAWKIDVIEKASQETNNDEEDNLPF